eukprot:7599498-Karenia_brevis.AAC.1
MEPSHHVRRTDSDAKAAVTRTAWRHKNSRSCEHCLVHASVSHASKCLMPLQSAEGALAKSVFKRGQTW